MCFGFQRWQAVALACLVIPGFSSGAAEDSNGKGWRKLTSRNSLKNWRLADSKAEALADWSATGRVELNRENPRLLIAEGGAGSSVFFNGPTGKTKDLYSRLEHGDMEAHFEFMVAERSNSGIYFMGRYEVQILDSFAREKAGKHDCGAIYERWDSKRGKGKEGFEGHPPRVNASRKPGGWQSFDVVFRAPRFDKNGKKVKNAKFVRVVHNGTLVHENVEVTGPTRGGMDNEVAKGPLRLQGDHGPVAYRNIRIRELD